MVYDINQTWLLSSCFISNWTLLIFCFLHFLQVNFSFSVNHSCPLLHYAPFPFWLHFFFLPEDIPFLLLGLHLHRSRFSRPPSAELTFLLGILAEERVRTEFCGPKCTESLHQAELLATAAPPPTTRAAGICLFVLFLKLFLKWNYFKLKS